MQIKSFEKNLVYKQLFESDINDREINIYAFSNANITGINLYYPNCLLLSNSSLYLPVLERTMSLQLNSVYEKTNMEFEIIKTDNHNHLSGHYFYFIYNTDNYYHFLYDTIPYLISYLKLKETMIDLKLLMQYPNPMMNKHYLYITEMLNIIGISDDDMIIVNDDTNYENIYVSTSYTHGTNSNSPPRNEIYDFYKQIVHNVLQTSNIETPKKIYISRRTWLHNDFSNIGTNYTTRRKFINEDEYVNNLILQGYIEVFAEQLTIVEKILYFYNATHIIGCIGGGIANVLFSKPETNLMAIISPTFMDINHRFKYSLCNVNVTYNYNTRHNELDEFKLYMRVKDNTGLIYGEIICINDHSVVIQYMNETNVGWNNNISYKTKELLKDEIIKLDNGLNSSFIFDF